MKTLYLPIVLALIGFAFLVAGIIISFFPQPAKAGNAIYGPHFMTATTSTQTWVRTNTQLLATTSANDVRLYTRICNMSTTSGNTLTVNLDRGKPADNNGTAIPIGTCYALTDENNYWGTINASSSAGINTPTLVSVLEYNQ